MAKLTVQLVTWNGAKYVPFLCESLRRQTFTDWELLIIDNASKDATVALLKKELPRFSCLYRLMENAHNIGFAGGHNQAFSQSSSEFVVLINQDMYLASDCLQKLMAAIEANKNAAVVAPRLMRWNFDRSVTEGLESGFTTTIDSLGLRVLKNRRVIELGAGETWLPKNQPETVEVFGVSGALPFFRRSSLTATVLPAGTVFDNLYESYKEDVDLAFRLRLAGFTAYAVMGAAAYHDRSAAHDAALDDRAASAGKRHQSDLVAFNSYKNHLATLYKNELWQNLTLDFLAILWYETKKFGYFLLFKPAILKGLSELWSRRAELRQARKSIQASKKITWKDLRKWWN